MRPNELKDEHQQRPIGECCICKTPIFNERDATTDDEGDHYCLPCYPPNEGRGDS
jgi:hypothetical protein